MRAYDRFSKSIVRESSFNEVSRTREIRAWYKIKASAKFSAGQKFDLAASLRPA